MLNNPVKLDLIEAVLGTASDGPLVATVRGRVEGAHQHIHNEALVHPSLTDGVPVPAGGVAWELGASTILIPEGTITNAFDIHWVVWEEMSANGVYELQLFGTPYGETTPRRVGAVRAARTTNQDRDATKFVETPGLAAGSAVTGRLACSTASTSVTVSLQLHDYS